MTHSEFKKNMKNITRPYDEEGSHVMADKLMCEVLRELGYGEGIDIFEKMNKWYA